MHYEEASSQKRIYKFLTLMNKWSRKNTKQWIDSRKNYDKKSRNQSSEHNITSDFINSTLYRAGVPSSSQISKMASLKFVKKLPKDSEEKPKPIKKKILETDTSKVWRVSKIKKRLGSFKININETLTKANTFQASETNISVKDIKSVIFQKILKSFTMKLKRNKTDDIRSPSLSVHSKKLRK